MGWEFLGRSLVCPWFILGLLQGRDKDGTREGNLKKSAVFQLLLNRCSLGHLSVIGRWNKARYLRCCFKGWLVLLIPPLKLLKPLKPFLLDTKKTAAAVFFV